MTVADNARGGPRLRTLAHVLGLSQAKRARPVDRLALAGDHHVLQGLVPSEMRRHAQR